MKNLKLEFYVVEYLGVFCDNYFRFDKCVNTLEFDTLDEAQKYISSKKNMVDFDKLENKEYRSYLLSIELVENGELYDRIEKDYYCEVE